MARCVWWVGVPVVLLAACASGPGPPAERPGYVERLSLLAVSSPAPSALVVMGDLDRAGDLLGLARPAGPDDPATPDWLAALSGGPPGDGRVAPLLPESAQVSAAAADQSGFAAELGWSVVDLDWFVEVQDAPRVTMVAGGRIREAALTAAMGAPQDGVWTAGDAADGAVDLGSRTVARPLGQTIRTTLVDSAMTVTTNAADLRAAPRDVEPETAALAELADERGCYSVVLSLRRDRPDQLLCLLPDVAGGAHILFAAAAVDDPEAEVERVERALGAVTEVPVTDVSVAAAGDVVTAELVSPRASVAYSLLVQQAAVVPGS